MEIFVGRTQIKAFRNIEKDKLYTFAEEFRLHFLVLKIEVNSLVFIPFSTEILPKSDV